MHGLHTFEFSWTSRGFVTSCATEIIQKINVYSRQDDRKEHFQQETKRKWWHLWLHQMVILKCFSMQRKQFFKGVRKEFFRSNWE